MYSTLFCAFFFFLFGLSHVLVGMGLFGFFDCWID